ncbi:MAG: Trk family potassium uptake protein [Schwartzia sp.]|nr:Trk family potassium uptake protein [Schwartzia sp. (in: firmicutes)]
MPEITQRDWRTNRILRWFLGLRSSQMVLTSFLLLIALGTLLFYLPWSTEEGHGLCLLDAFFMATSASCVTGLTVMNVDSELTAFGKVVLFFLMQLGGVGMMALGTFLAVFLGARLHLRDRIVLQESLNQGTVGGIIHSALAMVSYTIGIELFFAALFAVYFWDTLGWHGIAYGVFHAASTFCNAGFDIVGDFSEISKNGSDAFVLLGTALPILLGGLGFKVLEEVWRVRRFSRFSLHTKLVLVTSFLLVVLGTVVVFLFEARNGLTLGSIPPNDKLLNAFFMSVSSRTGGYASFDVAGARPGTLLFFCLMMFVGASPASTGGGIKTTTFAVILLTCWSVLRGQRDAVIFGRTITPEIRAKALTVFVIGALWLSFAFNLLVIFDDGAHSVLYVLFETLAAFSTGFGLGITTEWGTPEKLVLIATMLVGRVGILTFMLSIVEQKAQRIKYPSESIIIG